MPRSIQSKARQVSLRAKLLPALLFGLSATLLSAQPISFLQKAPHPDNPGHAGCAVHSFDVPGQKSSAIASAKLVTPGTRNNSTHVISIDSPYGFTESAGRQDVAKAFYTQNPDSYDFLFVFSDFEFPVPPNVGAYYHPVRNDVQGINMPIGDSGALFGSAKQLQGFVDMTWMSRYTFKRTDPNYQAVMKIAMHEVLHRYGPNVRYKNAANEIKLDLGNPVNKPHWSLALDTDASVMYGARWALQPDNSYRATETVARLHPLDLYVAGWGAASEVPDLKLLQMQPQPTGDVPTLGQIVTAPAITVPMSQIISAEGARIPAFGTAQNRYRAAIIFLTRPGVTASNARLLELDMFRRTFEDYFDGMTGGRASISFKLDDTQAVLTGPTVLDSSVPTGGTGITAAINWLESKAYTMPVSDRASSAVRDTMALYLALTAAKPASAKIALARTWLAQTNAKSADAAAAMLLADPANAAALAKLLQARSGDRFAISAEHNPTKFDSALAANALAAVPAQQIGMGALRTALGNTALGYTEAGQARLVPTILVAVELLRSPETIAQAVPLIAFIRTRYTNGGFFDGSERSLLASALVLQHSAALGFSFAEVSAIEADLISQQSSYPGSFGGSVFLTAQAVLGLEMGQRADLLLTSAPVLPIGAIYEGESAAIKFVASNLGKVASGLAKARLYQKQGADWIAVPGDIDLPAIASGQSTAPITIAFDTTGKTGALELALALDATELVRERSELNNRQSFTLTISPKPNLSELSLSAFSFTPGIITELPATIAISAQVRNVGLAAASAVQIGLYKVVANNLVLITEQSKTIAPGVSEPISFSFPQTAVPQKDYAVVIDLANTVIEANETNNRRDFSLIFDPILDLRLKTENLVITPAALNAGGILTATAKIENIGTIDAVNVRVELFFGAGAQRVTKGHVVVPLLAAGALLDVPINTQLLEVGELVVEMGVDPLNQIAESVEANNKVINTVTVGAQAVQGLTEWDDEFLGTSGPDNVDGLGGDDRITGGSGGNDVLKGGSGNDTVHCNGTAICQIEGGAGDDDLLGQNGVVIGGLGNDKIRYAANTIIQYQLGDGIDAIDNWSTYPFIVKLGAGLSSNNVVKLRTNDDIALLMPDGGRINLQLFKSYNQIANCEIQFLDGTTWNFNSIQTDTLPVFSNTETPDRVTGTPGDDNYSGLAGDDYITLGSGRNNADGGAGNDSIGGGIGPDVIRGGPGRDTINGNGQCFGDLGNDQITCSGLLEGGDGHDNLTGSALADQLRGGEGRDKIAAGSGDDEISGGAGWDRLSGEGGVDRYVFNMGDGIDKIIDVGSNTLMLNASPANISLTRVASELFVKFAAPSSDQIRATGIARIEFSNGVVWTAADISSREMLHPGAVSLLTDTPGNDVFEIDHPSDQIVGNGGGNDLVNTSVDFFRPLIVNGSYDQFAPFGIESINLTGELSSNIFARGSMINGNIASNQFGDDEYIYFAGNSVTQLAISSSTVRGGLGDDLYYIYSDTQVFESAEGGNDEVIYTGDSTGLLFIISPTALAGPTTIERIEGNGNLLGREGNDVLEGTSYFGSVSQANYFNGGTGADTYIAGAGNNTYVVDNFGDRIIDDGSNTSTVHSFINYTLNAEHENLILGGTQPIVATGSSESDMLQGDLNLAPNELRGGAGDDFYALGNGDFITEIEGEGSDTYIVKQDWSIDPNKSVENAILIDGYRLTGDSRNNRLTGTRAMNLLRGNAGDDWLYGVNENQVSDRLEGGAGADTLLGGSNGGYVTGHATGGPGNDIIRNVLFADFSRGDGQDVIEKVQWIRFRDYAFSELTRQRVEKDLILFNPANQDKITFLNFFTRDGCNTYYNAQQYIEFTDGLRRCSDFTDLIPISVMQINSVAMPINQTAVLRAHINAGLYNEVIERVEFKYDGQTFIDNTAPFEVSISSGVVYTAYVSGTAFLTGGKQLKSNATASFVSSDAPYVVLQSPFNSEQIAIGESVLLQAYAEGLAGRTISQVEFLFDNVVIGLDTSAPYELSWVVNRAGLITARATDNNAALGMSNAVSLAVRPAAMSPSVSFITPTNFTSAAIGLPLLIQASVVSDQTLPSARVDFYFQSVLIGTSTSTPASLSWTPTSLTGVNNTSAGYLDARVTDALGGVAAAQIRLAVVPNSPLIVSFSPASGTQFLVNTESQLEVVSFARVSGRVINKVDFYAGATLLGTVTDGVLSSGYTTNRFRWIPTTVGNVILTAKVTDSANTFTTSWPVEVTVANSGAPTVLLTSPTANSEISQNSAANLTANATGSSGRTISKVEFFNGATLLGTDTTSPYAFSWTPTATGAVSLTAKATDSTNEVATSTAVAVTVIAATAPTVSLTAPAPNANLPVNTAANLTANATASSGRTISKVEFFNGATLLGTDTTSPYAFSWTPTVTGAVSLTAKATDSTNEVATSTAVPAAVMAATAPTVSITAPAANAQITINSAANLTANATASSGRTISKVEFFNGATLLGTDTTSPYAFSWTPTATGAVSLTAKATDSTNEVATSTAVAVTVIAATTPTVAITAPAANAQITVNTAANLMANATASSGRTISKVEFFNGATLLGTDTSSPYAFSWTPTVTGGASLTAKATDSTNEVATSTAVAVSVIAATAPTVSITAPAANANVTINNAVNLTANATASSGRTISKVEFFNGATLIGTDTSSPYAASWTPTVLGVFSLNAKATDSTNAVTTSTAVSVTVIAAPAPPTVSITAPAANAQITVNTAANLTANAAASSGRTISKVEFFNGATLLNSDTTSPYAFSWTPTATGAISLTAKATDSTNAVTTSAAVAVTVIAAPAPPTVAMSAPAANAQLVVNRAVTLTANAAASAGRTISKVEFFSGTTLVKTELTAPYSVAWTPTTTGAISLTAKATDSANAVTTSAAIAATVVAQDGTPSAFNFGTATAAVNAVSTSAERTPTGYNIPIAISITGGSYSIDGGAYVTTAGTLNPGGRLRVRVTAGGTVGSTRTATLTAGGVNATYVVTAN